ncbi:FecR family protein [Aureisphaera galaxeae]|uniref:FecR family protein n=1 Tax=Aureisphaera galaxeae TaxID=1538023 RepID=UPI002350FF62|nr:FecR family protein [Aureisphaera galaxeae]MDC8005519.1 FecR family protein [Aureisphaera galaxeae]
MKKEDLIIKWLDNNLNEEELRAFKKLDASSAFMKIDEAAHRFGAPSFDEARVFEQIQQEKGKAETKTPWTRYVSGIAAAIVVSLGLYFAFFNTTDVTYIAENATRTEFTLPDQSEVILNAGSRIVVDEDDWSSQRELQLNGEAYFKVATGTTFNVITDHGIVSVLGTEFTVNARDNYFEVTCFEGVVQVRTDDTTVRLPAGKNFKIFNGQVFDGSVTISQPSWVNAKTTFKSVPYYEAISELERQYDIEITFDPVLNNTLYTGSFTHENLETALEAITIPLNLSYDMKGKNVVLKSN